ncbi:hypothetical protein AB4Z21_22075 [Paenibacillus sp. MCAF20]
MKRGLRLAVALLLTAVLITTGCSSNSPANNVSETAVPATAPPVQTELAVDEQPGKVFYEIFVRSFYDTDGDGIGESA